MHASACICLLPHFYWLWRPAPLLVMFEQPINPNRSGRFWPRLRCPCCACLPFMYLRPSNCNEIMSDQFEVTIMHMQMPCPSRRSSGAAAAAAQRRWSRTLPAACSGHISGPITMAGAWHEALGGRQQAANSSAHLLTALLAVGLAVAASRLASKLMRRSRRPQAAPDTTTAAAAVACGLASSEDEVTASAKLIAGTVRSLTCFTSHTLHPLPPD